jgi:hypothetical protein
MAMQVTLRRLSQLLQEEDNGNVLHGASVTLPPASVEGTLTTSGDVDAGVAVRAPLVAPVTLLVGGDSVPPARAAEVIDAANPQLRLTRDASHFADLSADPGGQLRLIPSAGATEIDGSLTVTGNLFAANFPLTAGGPPTGPAGGDLGVDPYPNPRVVGLQGTPLPAATANGFLKRNAANTAWEAVAYCPNGITTANTVCGGDDGRLSNSRSPLGTASATGDLAGSTYSHLIVAGLQDGALPTRIADGFIKRNPANTAWEAVAYGVAADTVCQGNDVRVVNAIQPSAAATGDLAGSTYASLAIAPGAVGNAKISDVAWSKVTGAPTGFPPSGAAGGDLGVNPYPNPQVIGLRGQVLPTNVANGFLKRNGANGAWEEVAYGTAANTVCQGNDSRFTGPAGGDLGSNYPNPTVLRLNGSALPANVASGVLKRNAGNTAWEEWPIGTTAGTIAAGDDSRFGGGAIGPDLALAGHLITGAAALTGSPPARIEAVDASAPQLRLTQTAGTNTTDLQTDSFGGINLKPSGGWAGVNTTAASANFEVRGSAATAGSYHLQLTDVGGTGHVGFLSDASGNLLLQPSNARLALNGAGPPARALDVLDATNPQLRLTRDAGTNYAELQADGSGYLLLSASGNRVGIFGAPTLATFSVNGIQPPSVATATGTAAQRNGFIGGGTGGITTIATTGTGGTGAGLLLAAGDGGGAPNALTGCTGGGGGSTQIYSGNGAAAAAATSGINKGGNAGGIQLICSPGAAASGTTTGTNTGGTGGAGSFTGGNGGAATNGAVNNGGPGGGFTFQCGAGGTGGVGAAGGPLDLFAGNGGNGTTTNGSGANVRLRGGTAGAGAGTAGTRGVVALQDTGGFVGVGLANPGRALSVLDASSPQLRLAQAATTVYTDFQTDASGNLTITPTGGTVTVAGNLVAPLPANAQTANYTLVLADAGKCIEMNSTSNLTLSIPTNASVAFPIGTLIEVCRVNTGTVTVAAVTPGTTTLQSPSNKVTAAAQYSTIALRKRAADLWLLSGDLA